MEFIKCLSNLWHQKVFRPIPQKLPCDGRRINFGKIMDRVLYHVFFLSSVMFLLVDWCPYIKWVTKRISHQVLKILYLLLSLRVMIVITCGFCKNCSTTFVSFFLMFFFLFNDLIEGPIVWQFFKLLSFLRQFVIVYETLVPSYIVYTNVW